MYVYSTCVCVYTVSPRYVRMYVRTYTCRYSTHVHVHAHRLYICTIFTEGMYIHTVKTYIYMYVHTYILYIPIEYTIALT